MTIRQFTYLIFALLISLSAGATHNRSGAITFVHISGYTYEFTISTCTKSSSDADRPELEVLWGDGSLDTIPRESIQQITFDVQKKHLCGSSHIYWARNLRS